MRVEHRPSWPAAVAWLVQAVRQVSNHGDVARRLPPPSQVAPDELAAAAEFHGVQGFALAAAADPSPALRRFVHAAQSRHLRAMENLAVATAALGAEGIECVVTKGPALVATSYSGPVMRAYVDLDLLVRPSDVRAAVRSLERAGCRLLDVNWPVLVANETRELRLEGLAGGAIDVHWSLDPGVERSGASAEVVMGRAVLVAGDPGFRIPGPADLAVHVAVHAADSGGHRLLWLADFRGAVDHALGEVTVRDILDVAREWNAVPATALMARRTYDALRAEHVCGLAASVRSGPWTALVALSERVAPPLLAGEGGSLSRLVARSCRRTPSESLLAAGRKSWTWAASGRHLPPGAQIMNDATDPRSPMHPVADADGSEAFFDWVEDDGH
jgi:hypothetical protein